MAKFHEKKLGSRQLYLRRLTLMMLLTRPMSSLQGTLPAKL